MPSFTFAEVPRDNVGTYEEALIECERLNAAGHLGRSNWRLPTVSELLPLPREIDGYAWCCDPSRLPGTAWVVSKNSFFVQAEGVTRRALIIPVSEDLAEPEPERKVTGGKSPPRVRVTVEILIEESKQD